jgi:hypothetical protein
METQHFLEIAPKSYTFIPLTDIVAFVHSLVADGLIESSYQVLTGKKPAIMNASFKDFESTAVDSALSIPTRLAFVDDPDTLSSEIDYVFKIYLRKGSGLFSNLPIFKESEATSYPLFVLYFNRGISYSVLNQALNASRGKDTELSEVNCVIKSAGVITQSLQGLVENQKDYPSFFGKVAQLFSGNLITGAYYG